ncbi:MAG: WecB/TagA/CpsF family glycosyltransferase [Chloroflexota bacterium]
MRILGVRVDDVTYDEAVHRIQELIASGSSHLVTTPNPEIVMAARVRPDFRDVLNRATLNIPDGVGLLLAARLRGERFREHVRGTDLVERLAAVAGRKGQRWFLLGADEGVAQEAATALQRRHPGLVIAGADAGSPHERDDPAVRERISRAGRVDVILVAYGAERQELWMARNLAALGIPVGIGVGGVFNFIAGRVPRAPVWMRRLELEWLHRLMRQPSRWRRQLALPRFLWLALQEAMTLRGGSAA